MDDLDREIEEAARIARRRGWQELLATIASTAALLVIGIGDSIAMYQLFPEAPSTEEKLRGGLLVLKTPIRGAVERTGADVFVAVFGFVAHRLARGVRQ